LHDCEAGLQYRNGRLQEIDARIKTCTLMQEEQFNLQKDLRKKSEELEKCYDRLSAGHTAGQKRYWFNLGLKTKPQGQGIIKFDLDKGSSGYGF